MADHPTDNTANEEDARTDDTLSSDQSAASSTDDKTVPLAELVKIRQRAAQAEQELKDLKAKLDKQGSQANKKDPQPPQSTESNPLEERLKRIERQETLRSLMSEHGMDPKQADAVQSVMDDTPGLSPEEARQVAALRDPDTFAEGSHAMGYDPATHGSSRPRPGSMPDASSDQSDYEDRLAYAESLLKQGGSKKQHQRVLDNLVGRIAARQTGRTGHQLIPVPTRKK